MANGSFSNEKAYKVFYQKNNVPSTCHILTHLIPFLRKKKEEEEGERKEEKEKEIPRRLFLYIFPFTNDENEVQRGEHSQYVQKQVLHPEVLFASVLLTADLCSL